MRQRQAAVHVIEGRALRVHLDVERAGAAFGEQLRTITGEGADHLGRQPLAGDVMLALRDQGAHGRGLKAIAQADLVRRGIVDRQEVILVHRHYGHVLRVVRGHSIGAAARRVAEGGPVTFNPLFLYGGVGLGKTHLMHAIAHELQRRSPELNVLYLSAEQFMYRFITALRDRKMMDFKQMFRSVDVLMVDDVQFMAGKDSTQEEFFHTFNALIDGQKQIIISADRAPGEIKDLEERIKSRLQCGLVVDLHPTDYELRLGILQSKVDVYRAQYPTLEIATGVIEFLAHRISTNVRVLEGALTRLFAFASLVGREITLELTQDCLSDVLKASDRKVTVEEIQRRVSEHYNIRLSEMIGPKRVRTYARPRQMAMYLAKHMTSRSLPEIGRRFGGRDHTTVMHGVKRITELKLTDSQIADDLELLRRALSE